MRLDQCLQQSRQTFPSPWKFPSNPFLLIPIHLGQPLFWFGLSRLYLLLNFYAEWRMDWICVCVWFLLACGSWDSFMLSVQFSLSVMSDSLQPHALQHARLPCPSPTPGAYSNSCPSSLWCHPTISSSVIPFSSCLQSFPASGSFQMSEFLASGGQRIAASTLASVLPMNIQDWFPLGWTGWISLLSKGLSKVFSNTTVWKHQFFGTQLSL